MRKILYIKITNSSFIHLDEEILNEGFIVKSILLNFTNFSKSVWSLFRMLAFIAWNLKNSEIVFIRFADYYAAVLAIICKVFRLKLVIVVGGYDAVHIPEYHYGVYDSKLRGACVKFAFNNANLILPNNPTLIKNVNSFSNSYHREEGVLHFAPNTKAKIMVIYNGFKQNFWNFSDKTRTQNIAITVAITPDYKTFKLKGIDLFLEAANYFPTKQFIVVGIREGLLAENNVSVPSNVEIYARTDADQLRNFYHKSKIFCLLSLTEGMPNVLCEAMLCGCIPVGTAVNSIPEIIGESGFVIKQNDLKEICAQIELGFLADDSFALKASNRISENYSFERRKSELTNVLQSL